MEERHAINYSLFISEQCCSARIRSIRVALRTWNPSSVSPRGYAVAIKILMSIRAKQGEANPPRRTSKERERERDGEGENKSPADLLYLRARLCLATKAGRTKSNARTRSRTLWGFLETRRGRRGTLLLKNGQLTREFIVARRWVRSRRVATNRLKVSRGGKKIRRLPFCIYFFLPFRLSPRDTPSSEIGHARWIPRK